MLRLFPFSESFVHIFCLQRSLWNFHSNVIVFLSENVIYKKNYFVFIKINWDLGSGHMRRVDLGWVEMPSWLTSLDPVFYGEK